MACEIKITDVATKIEREVAQHLSDLNFIKSGETLEGKLGDIHPSKVSAIIDTINKKYQAEYFGDVISLTDDDSVIIHPGQELVETMQMQEVQAEMDDYDLQESSDIFDLATPPPPPKNDFKVKVGSLEGSWRNKKKVELTDGDVVDPDTDSSEVMSSEMVADIAKLIGSSKDLVDMDQKTRNKTIQDRLYKVTNAMNAIFTNTHHIRLLKNQTGYKDVRTGELMSRVTNHITDEVVEENALIKAAQKHGNRFDLFIRNYFDKGVDPNADYYNFTSDPNERRDFMIKLGMFKKELESRGEYVVPKDVLMHSPEFGIAGTVDLLTIDSKGEFRIYDIKTMRFDIKGKPNKTIFDKTDNGHEAPYDSTAVWKTKGTDSQGNPIRRPDPFARQDSRRMKHQKQLSMYSIFLEKTYGIKVAGIGILPIEISYEPEDANVKAIRMHNIIPMETLTNVRGVTASPTIVAPAHIEFPLGEAPAEYFKYISNQRDRAKQAMQEAKGLIKTAKTPEARAQAMEMRAQANRKFAALQEKINELRKDEGKALFSQLNTELTGLERGLDSLHDPHTTGDTIAVLKHLITGTRFEGYHYEIHPDTPNLGHLLNNGIPEYDALVARITALESKYNSLQYKMLEQIAKEDPGFVKNVILKASKLVGDGGLTPEEIKALQTSYDNDKFLHWFSKNFLGQGSSMLKESVLTQLIPNIYDREKIKQDAKFKIHQDRVTAAYAKLKKRGITDFNWLMQRNKSGAPTGALVGLFSPAFYGFQASIRATEYSREMKKADKARSITNMLRNETMVLKPQMFPEIKEMYGDDPDFKSYFTATEAEMEAYKQQVIDLVGEAGYRLQVEALKQNTEQAVDIYKRTVRSSVKLDQFIAAGANPFQNAEYLNSDRHDTMDHPNPDYKSSSYPDFNTLTYIPKREIEEDIDDKGNPIYSTNKYYSEGFEDIEQDPDKLELWEALREGFMDVNNVYNPQNIDFMALPFNNETLLDKLSDKGVRETIGFLKDHGISASIKDFLLDEVGSNFFVVEKDNMGVTVDADGNPINSPFVNYENPFFKQTNKLKRVLMQYPESKLLEIAQSVGLTIPPEASKSQIAQDIARKRIAETYSDSFVEGATEVFKLAAQHAAREKALPKARLIRNAIEKGISTIDNDGLTDNSDIGGRKTALEKADNYIAKIIENRSDRGGAKYEETKKKLEPILELTEEQKAKGLRKVLNGALELLGKKQLSKKERFEKNLMLTDKQLKLLSEQEKTLIEYLDGLRRQAFMVEGSGFKVGETQFYHNYDELTGESEYSTAIPDKNGNMKKVVLSEELYFANFERHIEGVIADLGIGLSASGFQEGFFFLTRLAKLGFQPISGFHNRLESKLALMALDLTGEFWPRGAASAANSFLAGLNIDKSGTILSRAISSKKKEEFAKVSYLMRHMGITQTSTNDLDKLDNRQGLNDEGDWKSLIFKPMMGSIGYPEFKNQAAVLLSMLSGQTIIDNKGNEVPLFDGGELTAWNIDENGVLRLKDEFRYNADGTINTVNVENWENFSIMDIDLENKDSKNNDYELFRKNVNKAIKRTQGNYSEDDTILATTQLWGRVATFFFKWLFEKMKLLWGKGGTYNLNTGEVERPGRYFDLMKNTPITAMFGASALGIGVVGATTPLLVGLGVLGAVAVGLGYKQMIGTNNKETDGIVLKSIHDTAYLLSNTLIEFIDLPLNALNLGRVRFNPNSKEVKNLTARNFLEKRGVIKTAEGSMFGYTGRNMDASTAAALTSTANDFALAIWAKFVLPLIISLLLYDDEDEPDDWRRRFMNWSLNQSDRIGSQVTDMMNVVQVAESLTDGVIIGQLGSIQNATTQLLKGEFTKASSSLGSVFVPKLFHPVIEGMYDATTGRNANKTFKDRATGMILSDRVYNNNIEGLRIGKDLATDGRWGAKREYEALRKERIQELMIEMSDQYEGSELKEQAKKALGSKPTHMSHLEAIEHLETRRTFKE